MLYGANIIGSLPNINRIKIPRNINPRNTNRSIDLHCCFSHTSENGYGACVYCTYADTGDETASHTLYSKSRVAPLGQIHTIGHGPVSIKIISLSVHDLPAW